MTKRTSSALLAYEAIGGWGVRDVIADLRSARERWRIACQRDLEFAVREFPSREALRQIATDLCGVLFPMRLGPSHLHQEGEDYYVGNALDVTLNTLFDQVRLELGHSALNSNDDQDANLAAAKIVKTFAAQLPEIRSILDRDVEAAYEGDPAARSVDEVLLCYPGVLTLIYHRLAHSLYRLGVPLVARIIAEIAHSVTGIDIHPGAQIGPGFFIDHGTGVVIGETTVIGQRVRLYQAVTLGARRFTQDESGSIEKGVPRHPILEDEVVVYAGATILGRITIGRGSSIGGNVWLTRSVPAGTHVSQASLQHEPGGAGRVTQ